jgi:hypothetical protein
MAAKELCPNCGRDELQPDSENGGYWCTGTDPKTGKMCDSTAWKEADTESIMEVEKCLRCNAKTAKPLAALRESGIQIWFCTECKISYTYKP